MAKLNGASALPDEAQAFLASYQAVAARMPEAEATEATIQLDVQELLRRDGRRRNAARIPSRASEPATEGNVTAFRRPPPQRPKPAAAGRRPNPGFRWR